ncbi:hypothetical protein [Parabacteroides provencensis]|uniref:hypothetical protein n=1 Tax=Parabacteroides provencensis TaxID=1944636 RepID=UPI000C1600F7|nr:hypothetical protein [Parabacteroides provencensis]
MKKLSIQISGISRNTDDSISKDGECIELINARVKNGSISPTGKPIQEIAFPSNHKPVYIHVNSGYEHYISYDSINEKLYFDYKKENGKYISIMCPICSIASLQKIESIGNTLIAVTENDIVYLLFKKDTYIELGTKPPFPIINFSLWNSNFESEKIWCDIVNPFTWKDGTYYKFDDTNAAMATNVINGSISRIISKLKDKGYISFPIIVRYALRLYDGSYICHSAPILLLPSRKKSPFITINPNDVHIKDGKLEDFYFNAIVDKYTLNYNGFDTDELKKWKDIVSGIDIFVSNPVYTVDLNKPIEGFRASAGTQMDLNLNFYGQDRIIEDIVATSTFYKIHTFEISDSISGGSIIKEGMLDNLEQKESLPDDAFSHNTIIGKSYVYNSRLHIGNIKNILFSGYPINLFKNLNRYIWDDEKQILSGFGTAEVHINTSSGEKVVSANFSLSSLSSYGIIPYLSYPDSRAYKMIIRLAGGKQSTFLLKPHPFLNLAYNLDSLTIIDDSYFSTIITPGEIDNIEINSNKVKVSEVNNPFFFPAKNTYTPSSGSIVAMCSNTAAISQGQFGQYPLYCFCSDGIYALMVGSSEVVYTSSAPVSRDVCLNTKSVTPIDNAVIFATESGIMSISGSVVSKLSDKLDGFLPTSIESSPTISNILNIPKLKVSTTEFRNYIEKASIGYIYEEKEIIVSNSLYSYSYVYSQKSNEWYKISTSVLEFLDSYPRCFAVFNSTNGYAIYNMYNPYRTINDVAIISRPIKLGSVTHKRILQSALRGIVKPSLSDVYFRGEPILFREENVEIFSEAGFYILGSNDAEHFTLLSGTEKISDIRDLITKMNKTKAYKYFMFCLVGGVRTDVAINYIEIIADETYTNRLR